MSKRRSLVQEMCDNLQTELKANQGKPEWTGIAALVEDKGSTSADATPHFNGHDHAQATLKTALVAASSSPPAFYNDNQAWGDAIASAVAASQQVAAWPEALRRICSSVFINEPAGLPQARTLIIGFRTFGLAEAEVLELVLQVSTSLHGLTIHDGGELSRWPDQKEWAHCVAALARGVAKSPSLNSLNLRHINLHGEAGRLMAEGIRDNTHLTVLRFAKNGLEAANFATAVNGKRQLQTLAVEANSFGGEVLREVSALVASSRALTHLSLPECHLGREAGTLLAEAVQISTARLLPLEYLDVAGNELDSSVGLAIASALQGNQRLTTLKIANNPMSREAWSAVMKANEAVCAAWRASPEGRATLAHEQKPRKDDANRAEGIFGQIFGGF